jgi:hypothetical protein
MTIRARDSPEAPAGRCVRVWTPWGKSGISGDTGVKCMEKDNKKFGRNKALGNVPEKWYHIVLQTSDIP